MNPPKNDWPDNAHPDLLTIEDARVFLGKKVSASMIYQWCAEKRLPHLRLGGEGRRGKILIRGADLMRFLEENRIGPHPLLEPPS